MGRRLDPYSSMWDWLLLDLRHLCKTYGLSHEDLAKVVKRSRSHVSNILGGRRILREEDADLIDRRYGTADRYKLLLHWARRGHDHQWFREYFGLEADASEIMTYEALAVPGLLQLPEYAAELFRAGGATNVDELVEERMARQQIFEREPPPMLWMIISQNVIDWPIGGPGLLKRQLKHLLEMAERPTLGLRVVPRSIGAFNGFDGSFLVIAGDHGEVAYTESPGGGRLVSAPTEVWDYKIRYNRIGQAALPEAHSREMIVKTMEGL